MNVISASSIGKRLQQQSKYLRRKRSLTPDEDRSFKEIRILSPSNNENINRSINEKTTPTNNEKIFSNLRKQLNEEKCQNDELQYEIRKRDELIRALKIENVSFKKRFNEMKKRIENSVELTVFDDTHRKLCEAEKKCEKVQEEYDTQQKRLADLQAELKDVYREKSDLQGKLDDKAAESETQSKKIDELKNECSTLNSSLETVLRNFEESQAENNDLRRNHESVQENDRNKSITTDSNDGSFFVAQATKSIEEPMTLVVEVKLRETEEELSKFKEDSQQLQKKIDELENRLCEKEKLEERYSVIIKELSSELHMIKASESENQRLIREVCELKNKLNKSYNDIKSFVEKSSKDKQRLLNAIKFAISSHSKIAAQFKQKKQQLDKITTEKGNLQTTVDDFRKKFDECAKSLKTEQELREKVEKNLIQMREKLEEIKLLKNRIAELEQQLYQSETNVKIEREIRQTFKKKSEDFETKLHENHKLVDTIEDLKQELSECSQELADERKNREIFENELRAMKSKMAKKEKNEKDRLVRLESVKGFGEFFNTEDEEGHVMMIKDILDCSGMNLLSKFDCEIEAKLKAFKIYKQVQAYLKKSSSIEMQTLKVTLEQMRPEDYNAVLNMVPALKTSEL